MTNGDDEDDDDEDETRVLLRLRVREEKEVLTNKDRTGGGFEHVKEKCLSLRRRVRA